MVLLSQPLEIKLIVLRNNGDDMTKFKVDVTKANELCEVMSKKIAQYAEDCDKLYEIVKATKTTWIDPASYGFNRIVTNNDAKAKEIRQSLLDYHTNLIYFNTELGHIFNKREYSLQSMKIGYDTSYVNLSLNDLSDINHSLQLTLNNFANAHCPSDFSYLYMINGVYNAVANIQTQFTNLKTDVDNLKNEVNALMTNSTNKINSVELVTENREVTKFIWSLVSVMKKTDPDLIDGTKYAVNDISSGASSTNPDLIEPSKPNNVSVDTTSVNHVVSSTILNSEHHLVTDNTSNVTNNISNDYQAKTTYTIKNEQQNNNLEKNRDYIKEDLNTNFHDKSIDLTKEKLIEGDNKGLDVSGISSTIDDIKTITNDQVTKSFTPSHSIGVSDINLTRIDTSNLAQENTKTNVSSIDVLNGRDNITIINDVQTETNMN